MKKFLHYLPRTLSILFLIFISLFAFDEPILSLGFLMHLIPSFIFLIIILISWKKELFGGILFIILGIIFTLFFKTYQIWQSLVFISLPVLIIGILFLINSKKYGNKKA